MWWIVVVVGAAWTPVCFVLNVRRHKVADVAREARDWLNTQERREP